MTQSADRRDGTGPAAPAAAAAAAVAAQVHAGLFSESGQANPYPLYRRLHALGPVAAAPDGSLLVSGYELLSALLRDHRLMKLPERMLAASGHPDWQARPSLRLMYTSLLMLNPPVHTRLRRSVSAVFTARRVELLRPAVERIVADACARIAGDCDFVAGFAFPVPVNVIGELLGVPASDRPMFQDLARDWVTILENLSPAAVDRADPAATVLADYLAALAKERARRPTDDLISALASAAAADNAQLSAEELVTMAALLLAAGFETTTGLLSNGLVALLGHPGEAARLRTSPAPELAASAVEELLRYDSPVQILLNRTAPEDLRVAGLDLPAGQRVTALLGAANRDPAVFSSPDRLILDRNERPPLSFGGGIHYCVGAPLARLEAQVAFPALLGRFPRLALAGPPVNRPGIALHGHVLLPISAR
jgi:cytochrome P450